MQQIGLLTSQGRVTHLAIVSGRFQGLTIDRRFDAVIHLLPARHRQPQLAEADAGLIALGLQLGQLTDADIVRAGGLVLHYHAPRWWHRFTAVFGTFRNFTVSHKGAGHAAEH